MATRARSGASVRDAGNGTGVPGADAVADPPDMMTEHRNEVIIAGRLSAVALAKQLPSGDEIMTWRLIVDRRPGATGQRVDVVDCTAYGARVRRQSLGWTEDDVIEVIGSLRRRFWRSAGGLQSRCEVEVDSARRLRTPSRRGADAGAVRRRRKPG